jgi:hypothetical protein
LSAVRIKDECGNNWQNTTPLYTNAAATVWGSRGGVAPLAVPVCGFDGSGCPISPLLLYEGYIIAGSCIFISIILSLVGAVVYIV